MPASELAFLSTASGRSAVNIVVLGLSITSSWGNGHATTYRGLLREFSRRGHHVVFLERDVPWYAAQRDLPKPPYCQTILYCDFDELVQRYTALVRDADIVMVGSYVPEGVSVGHWVNDVALGTTVFYDIDTPVTLSKLEREDYEYLTPELIPRFDLYLSFTGGPVLETLQQRYASPDARPLYCSVDPELYYPEGTGFQWDIGYMGTYSEDRQAGLDKLMLEAARHWPHGGFVVAGPQYPDSIVWPKNVDRIEHLPPQEHRQFYNQQRFTLNLTRSDVRRLGYAPSVRLFEAAACGVAIVSDHWPGIDNFFTPGREILITYSSDETLYYLHDTSPSQRRRIGQRARQRVLQQHTAAHRAQELEAYLLDKMTSRKRSIA
ncbi:MAG: glycosyltransferase [Chloroflexi bacterium]|nr:glycosyltransferase [Chloroflexota bacterium]